MQVQNKQTITIDLKKSSIIQLPKFIQNDTNVVDIIVKENDQNADLSNITRIVVNYKRPDHVVISRLVTATGSTVTYEIGTEEMQKAGSGEIEIQFFENEKRISTKRFKVVMVESIGTDKIYEGTSLTLLQELFVEVSDVKASGDYAKDQGDYAKAQGDSAKTNWLAPVANYAAIATTYSAPKIGDTVQCLDNGYVYRYSGSQWVYTQGYSATAIADVNAKLAEKADKTLIDNIGNGSPKGVYATLSALQTAFPTGTTGVYLVTADGKWYYWNGSAWTAGGTYQSTGIADSSIVPFKTTFFEIGKNRYSNLDGNIQGGRYIADGTYVVDANYSTTGYIASTPNEEIRISANKQSDNTRAEVLPYSVTVYDQNKTRLSTTLYNNTTAFKTVPAGAYFIRISYKVVSGYKQETLQVEGGTNITSFEEYKEIIKDKNLPEISRVKSNSITESMLQNGSVTPYKTSIFVASKNRFNINDPDVIVGRYASNGSYVNDSNYKLTGYIAVIPSEELRISSLLLSTAATTEVLPYSVMYLDINKAVISIEAFNNTTAFRIVPVNCYYIRISVRTDAYGYSFDKLQVESGNVITDYDTFYPKIKKEYLRVGTESIVKGSVDKSKFASDSNPLAAKTLLNFGDSIAAGDGTNLDGAGNKGYAQIISSSNGMILKNYAKGGATIAAGVNSIVDQVNLAVSNGEKPDYILFDGGTNDGATNGAITDGYDGVTLDTSTFCGAFEYICKTLITNFLGCKILYIRVHKMSSRGVDTEARHDLALQICEKWSIPYVNMFKEGGLNTKLEAHRIAYAQDGVNGGATHPTEDGYRKYYVPRIEAKMKAI